MPAVVQAAPVPVTQPAPAPTPTPAPAPAAGPPPGAWPIPRSFPPPGQEQAAPAAPATAVAAAPPMQQQPVAPQPQPQPPASASAQASAGAQQGAAQVRQMWPQILEAVKNRRRFTWILLSQNGQVAGFDGSTLQVSFINAGARDSFVSSNSDDVLKQALADALNVDWRVECIVDPSGSGSQAQAPAQGGTGGWGGGASPASRQPAAPAAPAGPPPAAPQAYQAAHAAQTAQAQPAPVVVQAPAPPPVQSQARPPQPPPQSSEEDDGFPADAYQGGTASQAAQESAISAQELIIRELGATVLEEIQHGG